MSIPHITNTTSFNLEYELVCTEFHSALFECAISKCDDRIQKVLKPILSGVKLSSLPLDVLVELNEEFGPREEVKVTIEETSVELVVENVSGNSSSGKEKPKLAETKGSKSNLVR